MVTKINGIGDLSREERIISIVEEVASLLGYDSKVVKLERLA